MRKILLILTLTLSQLMPVCAQNSEPALRIDIPIDSIRLSDPFILADKNTSTYYMTGTGGRLWKSTDLRKWTGPY
ncbi:hypothetical protein [Dyadobacter psychrophilus]|uniref:Glycosyl hydrolases family 43 n=1 Tax=Dyadobacter psychrophilus TaxID=651661 RepID=A0A1T5E8X2_9BACT|nr:hypothetical protein [Dyadobacter psychrophilus]SKB80249.1 hypothetical protein SAMN05660293_02227 [Dyadobacter psychrophilus]